MVISKSSARFEFRMPQAATMPAQPPPTIITRVFLGSSITVTALGHEQNCRLLHSISRPRKLHEASARPGLVRECPNPQQQLAADVGAARQLRREIFHSVVAPSADCERGSASADSGTLHSPPAVQGSTYRALDSDTRYTAAHSARHSYTAHHLARTPRATAAGQ